MTLSEFQSILPNTKADMVLDVYNQLTPCFAKYEINTPIRKCHFLAQMLHETGALRYREEIASGSNYEGRLDLGNIIKGDGVRFKGRGGFQLTGRANYRKYGKEIGVDLEGNPSLVATKYFVDVAGWFNSINGLNIRDGGGNSAKLSNEQKLKISNSLKGVRHSLERVEKNRLAQLNKKSSIEKRKREEMFPKVKKSRLGCTLTDTQKQHLRNINLGANNPNFGKQRTEESRGKTRESVTQYWKSKKLLCQKL